MGKLSNTRQWEMQVCELFETCLSLPIVDDEDIHLIYWWKPWSSEMSGSCISFMIKKDKIK